jgi:hypothetical protein
MWDEAITISSNRDIAAIDYIQVNKSYLGQGVRLCLNHYPAACQRAGSDGSENST